MLFISGVARDAAAILAGLTLLVLITLGAVFAIEFDENYRLRKEAEADMVRAREDANIAKERIRVNGENERLRTELQAELDKIKVEQENYEKRLSMLAVALAGLNNTDAEQLLELMEEQGLIQKQKEEKLNDWLLSILAAILGILVFLAGVVAWYRIRMGSFNSSWPNGFND